MTLLICLAQGYGVWQALILASPSRTIRWGTLLLAFVAGLAVSSPFALLLQLSWTHIYASVANQPYNAVITLAGYTADPLIEEIAKVLPLLLVCLVPRVRNQLGIADMVLICLALGSGFGLTEALLRYSFSSPFSPSSLGGNFFLSSGQSNALVPGVWDALVSWMPAGVTALGFGVQYQISTNFHLAVSAVNGLALGIMFCRPFSLGKPARLKKVAPLLLVGLPMLLTLLVHMANNAAGSVYGSAFWNVLIAIFYQGIEQHLLAFFPLVALGGALVLDRLTLHHMNAARQNLLLPDETQGIFGLFLPAMKCISRPRVFILLWKFVLRRRAYLFTCAHSSADPSLERQFTDLLYMRLSLEFSRPDVARTFATRPQPDTALPAGGPDLSTMTTSLLPHPTARPLAAPQPDLTARSTVRLVVSPKTQRWPSARFFNWLTLVCSLLLALPVLLYFAVGAIPPLSGVQSWFTNPAIFTLLKIVIVVGLCWQAFALARRIKALPRLLKRHEGQVVMIGLWGIMMGIGSLASGLSSDLLNILSGRGPLDPTLGHILNALEDSPWLVPLLLALLIMLLAVFPEILAAFLEFNPISELAGAVNEALVSSDSATVLEGEVANLVGDDLVGFQTEFGPGGSIGEIDVETNKAIIEVTTSKSGKLSQITKLLSNSTMNPTGKSVILYAPNYGGAAGQAVANAGGYVVRSGAELLNVLSFL